MKYGDMNGLDLYRYDPKSGDFILQVRNDDKFDQVGKFKHNKETGEYTLITDKNGKAKTRIDNIEKGILKDGINFKENSNVIETGEGKASVHGVETFVLELSDMVGKEIGGAYFSKDNPGETTHISIGAYKNNKYNEANSMGHSLWGRMFPGSNVEDAMTGVFHTHPSNGNISVSDRTRSSIQDRKSRDAMLQHNPNLQFYILTHPINYGDPFPYRFPYTTDHY